MKIIKINRDQERALQEVIRMASKHLDMDGDQKYLDEIQIEIERAPDDTVAYMDLVQDGKTV